MRKIAVWPRSWKCFSLRSTTVWPRCRSGAVGSMPSFTRSGLPVARDFSSLARRSASRMISAAPFFRYVSCSSTGAKLDMRKDIIKVHVGTAAPKACPERTLAERGESNGSGRVKLDSVGRVLNAICPLEWPDGRAYPKSYRRRYSPSARGYRGIRTRSAGARLHTRPDRGCAAKCLWRGYATDHRRNLLRGGDARRSDHRLRRVE